jgi:hypothetical protein
MHGKPVNPKPGISSDTKSDTFGTRPKTITPDKTSLCGIKPDKTSPKAFNIFSDT